MKVDRKQDTGAPFVKCPYGDPVKGCNYLGRAEPGYRELGTLTGDGYCHAYGDEAKKECIKSIGSEPV